MNSKFPPHLSVAYKFSTTIERKIQSAKAANEAFTPLQITPISRCVEYNTKKPEKTKTKEKEKKKKPAKVQI